MNFQKQFLTVLGMVCTTVILLAQTTDTLEYSRQEVMITMRDGIRLNTLIQIPKSKEPMPVILTRTPYGVSDYPSPNKKRGFN